MCALLLKAAVPMLASVSAQAQGVALVEVCTVYGVATVALGAQPEAPAHDPIAGHHDKSCALSGVPALAPALALFQPALRPAQSAAAPCQGLGLPPAADACALWVAGLKHGPPTLG
jgi:hypothetical protein